MTRVSGRGRVPVLLVAVLLSLAGCQAPGTSGPSPRSSPSAQDPRLQAADAKLLGGDYDGAETAYRALLEAEVPGAASHLSTLLAYEGRFHEAVTTARAGVDARADSDSLARLTRALDWSQQLDQALATGARAVAAKPVQPLAHVFYAEVLADTGHFDAAVRELRAAEGASGDAYLRSEIDREWANYYRARGDTGAELNYTQLAVKDEPRFPERQLDLIRYDYGNGRTDAARAAIDKLLRASGKNFRLLLATADSAFVGADGDRASSLYAAAAQVSPDPEAALGQAEVLVVTKRDFNGAHDLLTAALRRDPTSSDVYEYLRYLDLLLLKKDPDAELSQLAPQRPAALAADRKAALDRVNAYRSGVGMAALQEDPALAEAAQAHAYYYLFNFGQPQLQGLGIHTEDPSLPGFFGASSLDRDRHFGYSGGRAAEVIDHDFTPEASVETWADSVYHRYPLLDHESQAEGYGTAAVGPLNVQVLDLGMASAGQADPVVYPAAGQKDVPGTFTGNEIPNPLPQGAIPPTGYPVTLQVGGAQKLAIASARLVDPAGHEVPSYQLAPADAVAASEWAILAQQPLQPGATYTAEVTGKIDGQDFSRRWSFTVAAP